MKANFAKLTTLSLLLAAISLPACASEAVDDTPASEDDLSGSRILVLGSIGAGETKTFAYTAQPKYRAFTFAGTKGDKVTLHGSAANGAVVRLYVLGKNFRNLAGNGTRGGDLTYTLPSDGAYTFALFTQNSSATTLSLTPTVVSLPRASDAPGSSCGGELTDAGIRSLLADKPAATGADWVGNGHYVPGAVKLGDYGVTVYTRSGPAGGTIGPWVASNTSDGHDGRVLAFGSSTNFGIALTSPKRTEVDSGVPGRPCYHSMSGFGIGAAAGDPILDSLTIQSLSTCVNDNGEAFVYDAVVTDHCAKVFRTVGTWATNVNGTVINNERAVVYSATY